MLVQQTAGTCAQNLNRLWRRFSAPFVVLLDEDVSILQDGWLEALLEVLESRDDIGVVGCESVGEEHLAYVAEPVRPALVGVHPWVPAYVMAFQRDRVPFLQFDEAIPGDMGMTDVDACLQVRSRGLFVCSRSDVVVWHPCRDADETRKLEERPTVSQQQSWYPNQIAYMRSKWGRVFEEI